MGAYAQQSDLIKVMASVQPEHIRPGSYAELQVITTF